MKARRMLLQSEGIEEVPTALFESDGLTTYALDIRADGAYATWETLRQIVPRSGHWPVILHAFDEDFPQPPNPPHPQSHSEIIAAAERLDFAAWLRDEHERWVKMLREDLAEEEVRPIMGSAESTRKLLDQPPEFRGIHRFDWPGNDPATLDEIDCRLMGLAELKDFRLTLALVPVREGWQVPAALRWGGGLWPSDPVLHCAALKYWAERNGAELVVLSNTTMIQRVAMPPTTRLEARRLAKEQFFYCHNLVSASGVFDSLDELAARLIRGQIWYFFWD